MIPNRDLQKWLGVEPDGIIGPTTIKAARAKLSGHESRWPIERVIVANEQLFLYERHAYDGVIDGYEGPVTRAAWERWVAQDRMQPNVSPSSSSKSLDPWPLQRDVQTFYGRVGENQVMVDIPWKCYLTWDPSQIVKRMSLHKKVADSASRVFRAVIEAYGQNPPTPLCRYSGSLNVRRMVGGTAWSMHSWGIAIDWDDDHNSLNTHSPNARLSQPEFNKWWEIWESEGWVSLGRSRNYDWMHVQAARL